MESLPNRSDRGGDADRALALERLAAVMLAEHLHRTANAFANVLAVLDCIDRPARRRVAKRSLVEVRGEIAAMAALNRLLIPPLSTKPTDAADLVGEICTTIASIRSGTGCDAIAINLTPVLVAADMGWMIAVIVTELVENALKHAFHSRRGRILVKLGEEERGLVLRVVDDGGGMPLPTGCGRGSSIVEAAVAALGGRIASASSDEGTIVDVEVPTSALVRGLESMRRCGPTSWGTA